MFISNYSASATVNKLLLLLTILLNKTMKNILTFLTISMVFLFVNKSVAQNGFETQFNIGIPANIAAKEISNSSMSVDLAYLFTKKLGKELKGSEGEPLTMNNKPIHFRTLQYGISAGYLHTFNGDDMEDIKLIPIAAALRMYFFNVVSIGGALGYAVGLDSEATDGGGYMEASIGFGPPKRALIFTMKGVNLNGDPEFELLTANLGIRFQF